MNYATADARYIKGLKVRSGHNFAAVHGKVLSVRVDPEDRLGALVTVRLNSGQSIEYAANDELVPTEGSFRCDFCRKQKPDNDRRKVYGLSLPRSCSGCLSTARRFTAMTGKKGIK